MEHLSKDIEFLSLRQKKHENIKDAFMDWTNQLTTHGGNSKNIMIDNGVEKEIENQKFMKNLINVVMDNIDDWLWDSNPWTDEDYWDLNSNFDHNKTSDYAMDWHDQAMQLKHN